jgi:GntR family transcriptional regulator of vanillate catabolism
MPDAPSLTQTMRAQIELRERVLSGRAAPGSRLMEVALANEFGISRTPVREAMARLAEEGLLERVRSGGFRVRRFTFEDVVDAIEVRGVLEGTAARRAAERGLSDEGLAPIRAVLARLDAVFAGGNPQDLARYAEGNSEFHTLLWGLAGSEVIRQEVARVSALPFASPSAFTPDKVHIDEFHRSLVVAHQQHHGIVEAIAAREGTRAEALAREHARSARRNLEYLRNDGAGNAGLSFVIDALADAS